MPILPLEQSVFPETLFQDGADSNPDGRVWWVLHTKPRQEKSLAREMLQAGVPFYLPLVSRRSVLRGHVQHAHVPLFTSYFFLLASRDERITALTTKRVVSSLDVVDQPKLWHDLAQINRLISSGAPITLEERLTPGTAVEISSGPLAGLRGTIIRAASGRRFVVQVNFIQQGASVLLDDFHLTPVHPPGSSDDRDCRGSPELSPATV